MPRQLLTSLLLALFFPSTAAAVRSLDGGFSINLPPDWNSRAGDGRDSVIELARGKSVISIDRLSETLSDDAMRERIIQERAQIIKAGQPADEIMVLRIPRGFGYLTGYGAPGAEAGFGYFSVRGVCYALTAKRAGLAAAYRLLEAIGPPNAYPDAPSRPESQPPARFESSPVSAGEETASRTLPPPLLGAGAILAAVVVLLSAIRLFRGRKTALFPDILPTRSGSLFPMEAWENFCLLGRHFTLTDRAGRRYDAISRNWPSLFMGYGAGLYALSWILARARVSLPPALDPLRPASLCLLGLGLGLSLFMKPSVKIYENGALTIKVRRKWSTLARDFYILDPRGRELGRLRRAQARLWRKHWRLFGPQGGVLLSFRERSWAKSLLRRLLGHLGGRLRSELDLYVQDNKVGSMDRQLALANRFFLRLNRDAERALDHRAVLAAALFVEAADKDRWHPWWA